MKFGFEQRWQSTVEQVVDLYIDEAFWQSLDHLSRTSPPEVLEVSRDGNTAVTRLRYRLVVDLPKEASRFIDPDEVSWVEHTTWDVAAGTATVAFHPDQAASLLRASADVSVLAATGEDGNEVVRRITGDLSVRIPLLGRKVERVVVDGIGEHLSEEADSVADHLEG